MLGQKCNLVTEHFLSVYISLYISLASFLSTQNPKLLNSTMSIQHRSSPSGYILADYTKRFVFQVIPDP